MSGGDDTFLGRWSRRKLEPEVEAAPVVVKPDAVEDEVLSDEEILAKLELPDPDHMKDGDDFAAFMSAAVPDHLRRKALRKLWVSNPALANLDGLVDYGEDYTDAATVPGVINTAYKVGRGIVSDILEDPGDVECVDEPLVLAENEVPDTDGAGSGDMGSDDTDTGYDPPKADVEKHVVRPRMRFSTT